MLEVDSVDDDNDDEAGGGGVTLTVFKCRQFRSNRIHCTYSYVSAPYNGDVILLLEELCKHTQVGVGKDETTHKNKKKT